MFVYFHLIVKENPLRSYFYHGHKQERKSVKLTIHNWNPEMEFKEFEPRFKSAKTRFKLSACLNRETFDTILSGTNHIFKPLVSFQLSQ